MGIIKAIASAIGGSLADQWLEVLEPDDMSDSTVFTRGIKVRRDDRRNSNVKGTDNTVSNGSVIHVYPNQFMMLVDGGKVVDYTAEEGYYTVNNSSLPSLFSGGFGDSLKETFNRIKYGGVTPTAQKVFFVNLQRSRGSSSAPRTLSTTLTASITPSSSCARTARTRSRSPTRCSFLPKRFPRTRIASKSTTSTSNTCRSSSKRCSPS
jgi:hypothetical protein